MVDIVPKPVRMIASGGAFELGPTTRIVAAKGAGDLGCYLRERLQPATGYSLLVEETPDGNPGPDTIWLTTCGAEPSLGDEGYDLTVTPDAIVIRAPAAAGIFYGIQSLRQLLPAEIEACDLVPGVRWIAPAISVHDKPRFKWRGLMLDVARHQFPLEFIKRYIDLLALHKLNTFHWHLTDDQGWRIEIRRYPRLTEIGSRRAASPIPGQTDKLDGTPYGGYYTQEQIREVIAFAASRFVSVVPEIEMPGHAVAALASYPDLGCTGGPYEVRTRWDIEDEVLCAGNEHTYTFLEDVLSEVIDLFPGEFIHIGGDECPKGRWQHCPKCQAVIEKHGLENEEQLQSYFIRRIEQFLSAKGRRMIGWDEILEGGLAPNATVMSWRGVEGGLKAAQAGHDVVMSPTSHCYFDYYQSLQTDKEPLAYNQYLPLETVYNFEPLPAGLLPEEAGHVLGSQGNLWTEYIATPQQAEYMAYPRASALAEVLWSAPGSRDYQDFLKRLGKLLPRLGAAHIRS